MAKSRPSVQKRKKEAAALEKRQAKAARKAARAAQREQRETAPGVDPDIAHIKPGPQAAPEEETDYGAFAEFLAAAEESAADADRRR
jgi:hypothetical protein